MINAEPHAVPDPGIAPESIVIYTSITGYYDTLKEQPPTATSGVDLVAFLDSDRQDRRTRWQHRTAHREFDDQSRNAKIHKIQSHVYFPKKTYSLWIDGSVTINFSFPVERLVSLYLADCDLVLFRHYRRICVYQEARTALHRRLDDPGTIRQQIESYSRKGYPANAGLSECCVLLRRHTDAVKTFNEAWWQEICRGSRRDQLSFDYVAKSCGLKYRYFPGSVQDSDALFRKNYHRRQSRGIHAPRLAHLFGTASETIILPALLPALAVLDRYRSRRSKKNGNRPSSFVKVPADFVGGVTPPHASSLSAPQTSEANPPASGRRSGLLTRAPSAGPPIHSCVEPQSSPQSPFSIARPKRSVAFGPERDFPSWDWVGFDTSRELSKYYRMNVYDSSWKTPPDCDVLFIIKERPSNHFIAAARHKGLRIVYCPIDFYQSQAHLTGDAEFLTACDMVLVHCERLLPLVRSYCANSHFVEHHSCQSLPEVAEFKENGFILWVGGCQYLAYFVNWLQQHPIRTEVKILTDIDKAWSTNGARRYAALSLSRNTKSIAGCEVYPWSERLQFELMRECKAAIDVKQIEIFNQYYKPPTKAQKYIGSGIPFAVNPESYSAEYFRTRGFQTASPWETDRWFSRNYWAETRRFALKLRQYTSLEAVGLRYRELIDSLL